ncbi:PITH domain-containing protein At3g04780-like [Amaranthus tricolor]|uniref:PITH domain-containing protein At3g04780-like n=1 Tax=Amaranthus tricolor TaxID=29722 RepID=UPI00258F0933|nr:PITH domain-containing protein At3g04780-like [Amaranthus tricolor]
MAAESASAIHRNQVDLLEHIDWSEVECLNQKSSNSIANALKQGYREDDGLNLESDADEQLLIYIPFTQVIKLHSIVIKGPEEEGDYKLIRIVSSPAQFQLQPQTQTSDKSDERKGLGRKCCMF